MGIFAAPLIPLTWPLIQAGVAAVGSAAILTAHTPIPRMVADVVVDTAVITGKVVTAPIRGAIAVGEFIYDSVSGSENGSSSGNGASNGNGSSRTSDATTSNTNNGGSSQSSRRETEETGTGGGGNGGRGNGNGDRKKTDHEMDNQDEDEENNNENQTQQERTSKRKVCTAWLEAVDYPRVNHGETNLQGSSEETLNFRLKLVLGGRLNEGIFVPRLHLIYRSRMFFYCIGRLQKLCKELGLKLNDICKFGTSVYKDARQGKLEHISNIHAAHVFPVTDFNFDLIRERIRQRNANMTQDQINQLIRTTENILMNMVGHTDYVNEAYNASGTVGRALDNFLRDFIQENRNVNSGNIDQVVNSMIERMRSTIRPESRDEIEQAIRVIQSTNASEWLRLLNDGLNGVHDNHFNQTRRTIEERIKKNFKDGKKD